jgi:hypothetical protein
MPCGTAQGIRKRPSASSGAVYGGYVRCTCCVLSHWSPHAAVVTGDTKGLVGPRTTWREVQWTKVRMLIRSYGLRPWYCGWWPTFCDTLEW